MKTVVYTQRVEIIESYNERRDCADQRIAQYINACGFLPIALPNDPQIVKNIISEIKPSGIVLVGGNSLVKYGGNAPERDDTDQELIRVSIEKRIPLYGFCRGMQSILDYFGNVLVKVQGHVAVKHTVNGIDGEFEVNSYHNEACIELNNDELIATLKSKDGVIEKIRHSKLPMIGTMWHPERENPFNETDIALLQRLILNEE